MKDITVTLEFNEALALSAHLEPGDEVGDKIEQAVVEGGHDTFARGFLMREWNELEQSGYAKIGKAMLDQALSDGT